MKRLTLAALASATALVFAAPAMADFIAAGGVPFEQGNFALNLNNGTNVNAGSGTDDGDNISITSFNNLGVFTGELFDLAGGNATIKPDGTQLHFISFNPGLLGFHFTSFSTRGQLLAAGNVFVTVNDNLGQTFTFLEAKDQDWTGGIGVQAVGGTGEFITSVTVWTDGDGFKEVKQQTFGFQTAAVPAPALGVGLPGLMTACFGLWAFHKRRRALNA